MKLPTMDLFGKIMRISHLELNNFRNIFSTKLEFCDHFNILFGNNGAGKTSLLEAIYFLSMGRSFRTQHFSHLITHGHDKLIIFANIKNEENSIIPIGIERQIDNLVRIRIAEENVSAHSQITKITPVQLIAAKDYRLIESGSEYRRQLLDWGVFHMEHSFLSLWQKMRQTVRQRNALLKNKLSIDRKQINFWNQELEKVALELHILRNNYFSNFKLLFNDLITTFLGKTNICLEYYAGWNILKTLQEILVSNLEKDLYFGFTNSGPHRADLKIKINGSSAHDLLSRGQQKLLIYALRIAQGMLLKQQKNINCIYLIDDLPSELSFDKCQSIINILSSMNNQIFITGINHQNFDNILILRGKKVSMFHVEHGEITYFKK